MGLIESSLKDIPEPTPTDNYREEWFTRIPSGQSIKRTVRLKGYPKIPAGLYRCEFVFSGPMRIDKAGRMLKDGRIWIGQLAAPAIEVRVW
ncbi:hypothetical protein JW935_15920 [candidate division KSB1 bacterium]|nr:hypothetical protein [candidate division KSB1 bacterium]